MQRAAAQAERARRHAASEFEKVQKQQARAKLADEKERIRLFQERKQEEAVARNQELTDTVESLNDILRNSLGRDHRLSFEKLKSPLHEPTFRPGVLGQAGIPPQAADYLPAPFGFFRRLIPGSKVRQQGAIRAARERFDVATAAYHKAENARQTGLAIALAQHEETVKRIKIKTSRQHAEIDALKANYLAGTKDAIRQYSEAVLMSQSFADGWPHAFKVAYVPESKQFVVEYDFPAFEIVPDIAAYKYTRSTEEITSTRRSDAERRRLYTSIIAQTTLRVIYVVFNADYAGHIESIVFNGHVNAIDEATGHAIHPCLVTLRTTKELFSGIDLTRVDPETCLKGLNAAVSRRPTDLAPVKPVLEFDMVDPRFVEEEDIISGLDNRTNLMHLNPREFESLITNLFEKMGLETRQTRPSRDGGVDCVAYDPRPIFGGKVVIQAKRYKNTVGVSAVRDLYGTVQNEGASKGILVTTSGFGRASFEFADRKPLELLDGSNLLYLFATHANIEAMIEVPEDWKDPRADVGE
jgi:restriction system protein